jgi:predicted nucleic acid-binding protein
VENLDALIFVDTNILLDFYRIRKSDVSIAYLERLEGCKDRLIIGSQVEMEYKKNRQKAILEALTKYSTPDWGKLTPPALLADSQAAKTIEKKKKEISTQQKKVNDKVIKIFHNPSGNDKVYQALQRIFKNKSQYNLTSDDKVRFSIRSLASKRFVLGYPPRKDSDTSIGDALNWEWIIACAKASGKDVIIVTRDTDYEAIYNGKSYLNDWLSLEFNERISRQRKLILTDKLSVALKAVNAVVTQEMEEAEQEMLALAEHIDQKIEVMCEESYVEE